MLHSAFHTLSVVFFSHIVKQHFQTVAVNTAEGASSQRGPLFCCCYIFSLPEADQLFYGESQYVLTGSSLMFELKRWYFFGWKEELLREPHANLSLT